MFPLSSDRWILDGVQQRVWVKYRLDIGQESSDARSRAAAMLCHRILFHCTANQLQETICERLAVHSETATIAIFRRKHAGRTSFPAPSDCFCAPGPGEACQWRATGHPCTSDHLLERAKLC